MHQSRTFLWIVCTLAAFVLTKSAESQARQVESRGEKASVASKKGESRRAGSVSAGVGRSSILQVGRNPLFWPLFLCSITAVGFALERFFALRRGRVLPKDFVSRFIDRLSGGKLDRERALELCRAQDSPIARVFGRIVGYWGEPASEMRQAVGYDIDGELSDLKRNVRVLNGTATLAPLLGLLGTVAGMIESFEAVAGRNAAGFSKGETLAHGISLALGATAFGLAIAVFSIVAYYFLLNRLEAVAREMDERSREVIDLVAAASLEARTHADRRFGGTSSFQRTREA